jgi:hypothetical protein
MLILLFFLFISNGIFSSENITFYGIPELQDTEYGMAKTFFTQEVQNINCFTAIDIEGPFLQDAPLVLEKLSPNSLFIFLPCDRNYTFPIIFSFKNAKCSLFTFSYNHTLHVCYKTENNQIQIDTVSFNDTQQIQSSSVNISNSLLPKILRFMEQLYLNLKNKNFPELRNFFENNLETIISSLPDLEIEAIEHKAKFQFPEDAFKKQTIQEVRKKLDIKDTWHKQFGLYLTDTRWEAFFSPRRSLDFFTSAPCAPCVAMAGTRARNLCYWIIHQYVLKKPHIFQPDPQPWLTMVTYGAYAAEFETRLYHDLLLDQNIPPIKNIYYIEIPDTVHSDVYRTFWNFIERSNRKKIDDKNYPINIEDIQILFEQEEKVKKIGIEQEQKKRMKWLKKQSKPSTSEIVRGGSMLRFWHQKMLRGAKYLGVTAVLGAISAYLYQKFRK